VFILKGVKVLCFDILSQVFILKGLGMEAVGEFINGLREAWCGDK
jgi:hypothetical protein